MWKQRMISTDRGNFEVFISGSGEPICVTHLYQEFNSEGNLFANLFSDFFTVILINLKEAGNSDKTKSKTELSIKETIKDLESIRKELGYEQWAFGGHSTGGFIGLEYAITYANSLKSLIICGTAASYEFTKSNDCIYNPRGRYGNEMMKIYFTLFFPFFTFKRKLKARRRWIELSLFKPEKFDEYFPIVPMGGIVGKRMRSYVQKMKNYDSRHSLSNIKVPTLILCGRHDAQCPVEYSEEISKLMPNSYLVIFEESNHLPFLEEPKACQSALMEFLNDSQKCRLNNYEKL